VTTEAVRKVKITTETDILIDMTTSQLELYPYAFFVCNNRGNKKGGTPEETASFMKVGRFAQMEIAPSVLQ
jgi:hypothetical protein